MSRAVGSIEKSAWAARFKACAPFQFKEALEVAERLNWVVIEHRDDHSAKGDCLWAILPDVNPEFWLDATPTKDEAIAICEAMGWLIRMDCASTQKGSAERSARGLESSQRLKIIRLRERSSPTPEGVEGRLFQAGRSAPREQGQEPELPQFLSWPLMATTNT